MPIRPITASFIVFHLRLRIASNEFHEQIIFSATHIADRRLDGRDAVGNTAVIWAARFGKAKNLAVLAEAGADLQVGELDE